MWASSACPARPAAAHCARWACTATHFVPTRSGPIAEQRHQLLHWLFKHPCYQCVVYCAPSGTPLHPVGLHSRAICASSFRHSC